MPDGTDTEETQTNGKSLTEQNKIDFDVSHRSIRNDL